MRRCASAAVAVVSLILTSCSAGPDESSATAIRWGTCVLGNGSSLVTWEGSGHTAFTRSPCVDALLDEYLLSLSLPADGTRCPA